MKFSIKVNLLLIFFMSCVQANVISDSISKNNCDKKQYQKKMVIGNSDIRFQSACSNRDILKLSINRGSSFKLLSKFLYPYSFSLNYVSEIKNNDVRFAVIALTPSEPETTGSYYFAIINLQAMTLVADGYSDSEVKVYDLDKDGHKEIVYGINLSGINPLSTMLDFVPYPKVLDWNCHGGLRLVNNNFYPQIMNTYRKALSDYIDQLLVKSKNSSSERRAVLQIELDFSKAILASTSDEINPMASLMTNNGECE